MEFPVPVYGTPLTLAVARHRLAENGVLEQADLRPYVPGILAHCRYPFHTSLLEGINNKIKVLKRMAFGYRDDEYFFLKIMGAFPGFAG
mgnify:CR=1 FL=1